MLLETIAANLSGSVLAVKGVRRAGELVITADENF